MLVLWQASAAGSVERGAPHELCQSVLTHGFDAILAGILAKSVRGDHAELMAWKRDWQQVGLTGNCILQPALWIALSATWDVPSFMGGHNFTERALATAQRLASVSNRAEVLTLAGARVAMPSWGRPCHGAKLVRRALALNPAYLPAHTVSRAMATQNVMAAGNKSCTDEVLSRIAIDGVHRASDVQMEFLCDHVNETAARFSLGSVQLGYVGWRAGGAGTDCSTGDLYSHTFVLHRLQGHERPFLLDVGAGVGEFALLAVHEPRLRVFAFEPGPQPGMTTTGYSES